MPHSSNVEKVTIRVELSDGTVFEMHERSPSPLGDNPRYIARQVYSGTANVTHRIVMAVAGAYGEQIPPVTRAS